LLQKSVGDVWPRISSATALQKERSASSERGPSSERKSAGEPSAGASREAFVASRAHRSGGRGSAQGSGWREIVIQRFTHRQKRCVGRGTGAVKATGSCEESLPMQGTPDHHEASAFTGRHQRWSWRTPHHPTRTSRPKEGRTARLQLPRRWERREGETRVSRQGCQRLDRISAVGRKRPCS
jgi:hypothetical protein